MAWKQYPKKRQHRYPPQQPETAAPVEATPLTDLNSNGYPDEYEAQETQLFDQIRARRKSYGYTKEIEAYSGVGKSADKDSGDPMEEKKSAFSEILGM